MNEFLATVKADLCKPMSFVTVVWGCLCFTIGVQITLGAVAARREAGFSIPSMPNNGVPGLPLNSRLSQFTNEL